MSVKLVKKNIPREWTAPSFGDVIVENRKSTLKVGDADRVGRCPFFTSGTRILAHSVPLVSGENIFMATGGVANVKFLDGDASYSADTYSFRVNQYANAEYIYYVLRSRLGYINRDLFSGSGLKHLQKNEFKKSRVLLPPLHEQKKIAEILNTVDKEIQKIEEIIVVTQKLKRGLMKQLFTRGIGHAKFKNTELGQVPEDWSLSRLDEIAQIERGKFSHRPRNAPEFYGGDIPFIQTGEVVGSNGRIKTYTQSLNGRGLAVSRLFPKGTIVLTIAANIGDTGILEFDSAFPDSLVGITVRSEMDNVFLEYYLRTRKGYLNSVATQSAQKNINLQKLNPILVIKPSLSEQREIAGILCSVDEKIFINQRLKEKLTLLKKGLMQDLLSGRVRVKMN